MVCLVTAVDNAIASKTFVVRGLTSGPIQGLKAGDSILFNLARETLSVEDDCPETVFLHGVEIIYRKP